MVTKVLVVEDNIKFNNKICNVLEIEGFRSFSTENIKEAKKIFIEEKPSIILLDIMLPDGNGYDLIKLFKAKLDCWVIMMTALNDIDSKLMCYKLGADDYIAKPFDLFELIFKLNAIRKRILISLDEYKVGDIKFNIETFTLTCEKKSIIIQPSQIKLLKQLYMKSLENSFVNKFEIVDAYNKDIDESSRIQTLVARLRKNLSYIDSKQIEIETIYGKGYKMIVKNKE